jgi:hypothetical protein
MHAANHSPTGEANEKLHPVSRNRVWRSNRYVLYSGQGGCGRAKLGKQAVFGQSITFTLSRPMAIGFCRWWLGSTLARDVVCVGNPELALRPISPSWGVGGAVNLTELKRSACGALLDAVLKIRDALAHGRLVTTSELPATLWKFGQPVNGRVPIEFCEVMTFDYMTETWKMIDFERGKVVDCFKARHYEGLR